MYGCEIRNLLLAAAPIYNERLYLKNKDGRSCLYSDQRAGVAALCSCLRAIYNTMGG